MKDNIRYPLYGVIAGILFIIGGIATLFPRWQTDGLIIISGTFFLVSVMITAMITEKLNERIRQLEKKVKNEH